MLFEERRERSETWKINERAKVKRRECRKMQFYSLKTRRRGQSVCAYFLYLLLVCANEVNC